MRRGSVGIGGELRQIGVMQTKAERNWTAQIVTASGHEGLKPHFRALENEIRRVLARVDDPRDVRTYLESLRMTSETWYQVNEPYLHRR